MEDAAKNKLILILATATLIFFITSVSSCNNAYRQKSARNKEMAIRLDLEEKAGGVEQKINSLNQALEAEKAGYEAIKKALVQEQLVSQGLKEELQKVTELKKALEEDLKEALVGNKTQRQKK